MRNEEVVRAFLNRSSATNKHGSLVSNGTQLLPTRKSYQPEPSVILGFMRRVGTNSYAHVVHWFPRLGHIRVPGTEEHSSGHFTWSDAIQGASKLAAEMQEFVFEPII